MEAVKERLPLDTFNLPVTEIRRGYRSAIYFGRAKKIIEAERPDKVVTMQVFQKNNSVLCGVDEALAIIELCSGHYSDRLKAEKLFDMYMEQKREASFAHPNYYTAARHMLEIEAELNDLWVAGWDKLNVTALYDGDRIDPWEPVMHITGPLSEFVHLESVYLGVLARRTKIASNVQRVVQAANGKPVLFFADRFDHFATQGGDGYAAHIGGAKGVATDAMGAWWGEPSMGTMPHALIAAFDGDVVAATQAFATHIPGVILIPLVDFNNDCVGDALDCVNAFGEAVGGVRLDTSENMIDVSLARAFGWQDRHDWVGEVRPTGVNPTLVRKVREELDKNGGEHVKITVSGGFNVEKITAFEAAGVPADAYAVGSSLLVGSCDFTADVVEPLAKLGRRPRQSPRLQKVT